MLERAGVRIYIPRQDREYAIEVGLRMLLLRHIVEESDGLIQRWSPTERPLLDYYANSIAHYLQGTISSAVDPPGVRNGSPRP